MKKNFKGLLYAIAGFIVISAFLAGCNKGDEVKRETADVKQDTAKTTKTITAKVQEVSNKDESKTVQDRMKEVGFFPYTNPIPVEPFVVEGLDGGSFNTDSLKGKVTILNFWGPWCSPCRQEMPELEAFYQEFKSVEGFQLVATAIRTTKEKTKEFINQNGYSFPVFIDGEVSKVIPYVSQGIPITYIVDKNAHLLGGFIGPYQFNSPEFKDFIKELLK